MVKDALRSQAPAWLSANIVGMGYQVVAGTAIESLSEKVWLDLIALAAQKEKSKDERQQFSDDGVAQVYPDFRAFEPGATDRALNLLDRNEARKRYERIRGEACPKTGEAGSELGSGAVPHSGTVRRILAAASFRRGAALLPRRRTLRRAGLSQHRRQGRGGSVDLRGPGGRGHTSRRLLPRVVAVPEAGAKKRPMTEEPFEVAAMDHRRLRYYEIVTDVLISGRAPVGSLWL